MNAPKDVNMFVPSYLQLLASLPEDALAKEGEIRKLGEDRIREKLAWAYDRILLDLLRYAISDDCKKATINWGIFVKISENEWESYFVVQDLEMPWQDKYTFRGDNTSQMKRNGALIFNERTLQLSEHS